MQISKILVCTLLEKSVRKFRKISWKHKIMRSLHQVNSWRTYYCFDDFCTSKKTCYISKETFERENIENSTNCLKILIKTNLQLFKWNTKMFCFYGVASASGSCNKWAESWYFDVSCQACHTCFLFLLLTDVPDPPGRPMVTRFTSRSVTLSWTQSKRNLDSPITGYILTTG